MRPLDDDQIRAALARRSRSGLTEVERANILRAARLQSLQPRRRIMPRVAGWLAATAAVVVLVVIAVPILLSSPVPVARASSSPPPGSPSPLPIYSAGQLAAMTADADWTGKTVLSDARVIHPSISSPNCHVGQPCFAGILDGVVGDVTVDADVRDTLPGEGAPVETNGVTRWVQPVSMPTGSSLRLSLAAYRIESDRIVLLGPANLVDGQPWQADALAKSATQQASDDVYVVSGWMLQAGPLSCPPPFEYEQTPPPALDWYCGGSWVTAAEHRSIFHDSPNSGHIVSAWDDGVHAQNGAYDQFAPNPGSDDQGSIPRYGTYLMRNAGCQPATMGDCPVWRIVGRIDPGNTADVAPAPTVSPQVATPGLTPMTSTGSPPSARESAPSPPPLYIVNTTTLTLTVAINGQLVGAAEPGQAASFDTGSYPEPWVITLATESGRVIAGLTYRLSDIGTSFGGTNPDPGMGTGKRLDLSCGRLDVYVGGPILGGTFVPSSSPGDCDP